MSTIRAELSSAYHSKQRGFNNSGGCFAEFKMGVLRKFMEGVQLGKEPSGPKLSDQRLDNHVMDITEKKPKLGVKLGYINAF